MSTIGAVSSYASYSTYSLPNAYTAGGTSTSAGKNAAATGDSATNVTLSASAQAALSAKTFLEVIDEARTKLTDLLQKADSDSPYKDGKLVIDLSGFDRRELFAIAGNGDGTFTDDEIAAAAGELNRRFDAAMTGPTAVFKVTGDITRLYQSALTYLEAASPEEQATDGWAAQHDAVTQALTDLKSKPGAWPEVANDPVVDYLKRVEAGTAGTPEDFSSVAGNARLALDQQIADARAAGSSLTYSKYQKSGIKVDFSSFSSRALSAIALNEGDQFDAGEINAAKHEIASRGRQVLMSCLSNANKSSDPTALAQNLISAYGSLSDEERQAVGWSNDFYQAAIANYKSASYFASMFSDGGTAGGLASLLSGSSNSGTGLASLLGGS